VNEKNFNFVKVRKKFFEQKRKIIKNENEKKG